MFEVGYMRSYSFMYAGKFNILNTMIGTGLSTILLTAG